MVVKTKVGLYEIIKNVGNAFDIKVFEEKYLGEYFDRFTYIVGDLSSTMLRLKGFSKDASKKNSFKDIPAYLCESCAFRCAYFVLRKVSEVEFNELEERYRNKPNYDIDKGEEQAFVLEKVPFDKENLELENTCKVKPNIKFDMNKINSMKKYSLPEWLKDEPKVNKRGNNNGTNNKRNKKNN